MATIKVFAQREGRQGFASISVDPSVCVATLKKLILKELLLDKIMPLDEATLWVAGAEACLDDSSAVLGVVLNGMKLVLVHASSPDTLHCTLTYTVRQYCTASTLNQLFFLVSCR
jgi:hypothetical protein